MSQPYIVCPKCGMTSHNPNDVEKRYCGNCHAFHDDLLREKIPVGDDAYFEPDVGPRNTRFHMRILRIEPITSTRGGNNLVLECGHGVQSFGNLAHTGGVVLCTKCRDLET